MYQNFPPTQNRNRPHSLGSIYSNSSIHLSKCRYKILVAQLFSRCSINSLIKYQGRQFRAPLSFPSTTSFYKLSQLSPITQPNTLTVWTQQLSTSTCSLFLFSVRQPFTFSTTQYGKKPVTRTRFICYLYAAVLFTDIIRSRLSTLSH